MGVSGIRRRVEIRKSILLVFKKSDKYPKTGVRKAQNAS